MSNKIVLVALTAVFVLSSCASLRKGSSRFDNSDSIYAKEPSTSVAVKETPKADPTPEPAIMVRQEKVTPIEHTGPGYNYYIIIGSFQVLDNARRFRTELIEEGFTPMMLESEHGFFRVSVAAYNDELEARARLGQIRRQYDKYSDVWLLISM
jgi:cell division septation protein DedD